MRHVVAAAFVAAFIMTPAFAVEPGQAEGTLTVGGQKITLAFAYAIGHQKNEFNNRKDDIRIIVTDKALPDSTDFANIENSFPEGVNGLVVCIDNKHAVSHVLTQFPSGMYDAGYFGPGDQYAFSGKVENRRVEALLTSKSITTSTTKFAFEVSVNAALK